MSLNLTAEQYDLRQAVRRFLEDRLPVGAAHRLAEIGATRDDAVWRLMADQLELQRLATRAVPKEPGSGQPNSGSCWRRWDTSWLVARCFSTVVLAGVTLGQQSRWSRRKPCALSSVGKGFSPE